MKNHPNVLFITADQFRGDCLSGVGHPVVRTPNLDRLAERGICFRRHFANAAPCEPSRATLYTGLYLFNHRAAINGSPLDDRFTNVAREARRLGYAPALFGYTDIGVDPRTVPAGDPSLYSYEGVLPGLDPVCHLPEGDPDEWLQWLRKVGYDIPDDWRAFVDRPAGGTTARTQYEAEHSQTAFLTDRVIDYVDDQTEPWFVHLSFLRPHPPYLAPAPYDTMYDPASVPDPVRAASRSEEAAQHPLLGVMIDHPLIKSPDGDQVQREFQATYYGMVSEVDAQLGRLFQFLDDTNRGDETVIVFTSDHGELLGDHWLVQKIGWFDTAFHVPLIIHDPRPEFDGTRGTAIDAFTEHVDVTPTICDLTGEQVPLQCDGRSLRPWMEGDTPEHWRSEVHHELDFRDPDSRLLEDAFGVTMEECSLAVLRDDHGKYVQFSGHHAFPPLFFDIDEDPAQLTNRAADPAYASKVLDYAQRMLSWRMRHTDRTLSGMKLTSHRGLVERRAERVR